MLYDLVAVEKYFEIFPPTLLGKMTAEIWWLCIAEMALLRGILGPENKSVRKGVNVSIEVAEAMDIVSQGGKFVITCEDGEITGLERVRDDQYVMSLAELLDLQQEAAFHIDEKDRLLS